MEQKLGTDIAILGAGPGGYVAALRAAQRGARVAVIERSEVGGTCLNRGCIPTKALLASVEVLHKSGQARSYGLTGEALKPDLAAMIQRKNRVVKQLVNGIRFLFKNRKIELVTGTGRLRDPRTIEVTGADGNRTVVTAGKVIIATGSEPARLPGLEPDGQTIITSTELLDLTEVPAAMLIIGAGAIGCEFATVFSRLGTKVTIVELLPQILPTEDVEIAGELRKIFEKQGIAIFTGVKVEKLTVTDGLARAELSNGQAVEANKVLSAVGRSLNTAGIGLEELGIKMDRRAIAVNERMETSQPGVYAIGDVTGKILLAHAASHQGLAAVANALGETHVYDGRYVPGCIYTSPEVASVGLSEAKAKAEGREIKIGRFPFSAIGKAVCLGETTGLVKMVTDAATGRLLGVHLIGPHATDLIAEAVLALRLECTAADLAETIHAHPTLSEALAEAAEAALGQPLHIL